MLFRSPPQDSQTVGELTSKVLREWLEYRLHHWPHTANPHLRVSKESALHHGPVSTAYLTSLRGLPATLEQLRIDCQLAEAMATGFDPLHLAEVFGISVDSVFTLAKYKEDQHLNFPLLSDFNKTVSTTYGALYDNFVFDMHGVSKRSAFVVDKQGIIRYAEVLETATDLPDFEAIHKTLEKLNN